MTAKRRSLSKETMQFGGLPLLRLVERMCWVRVMVVVVVVVVARRSRSHADHARCCGLCTPRMSPSLRTFAPNDFPIAQPTRHTHLQQDKVGGRSLPDVLRDDSCSQSDSIVLWLFRLVMLGGRHVNPPIWAFQPLASPTSAHFCVPCLVFLASAFPHDTNTTTIWKQDTAQRGTRAAGTNRMLCAPGD